MSVIFQTVINTGKLHIYRKAFRSCLSPDKCFFSRKCSDSSRTFTTFDTVVSQRKAQARRSLVVQVNSESSFPELYGYCSKFGDIKGIHHYNNTHGEHFMLVEFASEDNVKEVLQSCGAHQKALDVMALQSPFLWFRAVSGKKEMVTIPETAKLSVKNGNSPSNEDTLFEDLGKCETVSDQIQLLYDRTVLNDIGVRLRYMVARELEVIFSSLYANIALKPFGSSVNGFGRMGCDLDLVLTNDVTDDMSNVTKRLVYQEKKCEGGRGPWQRHMELVSEVIELRVPGAARVQRILNARVPIVKYAHEYTDVDCDLCYNNSSGVYMSELLWQLGTLDPRVRPLAFAVRRWAQAAGLTNPHPGRWITNFPLTLMVLYFLQHERILPSFKALVQNARKDDVRIAEDNVNCTFLRDMNKLPPTEYQPSSDSLEQLLLKFFEFYAQFDFHDKGISIVEGATIRKPNNWPLYIVNPLEPALNVSRNVSYEECERIMLEVRNAAWQLETLAGSQKSDDWGLLGLIEKKATRGLKKLLRVGNSQRLVSVKDLFKEETSEEPNEFRNKIGKVMSQESDSNKNVKESKSNVNDQNKIKFKNSTVENAVKRIRRDKLL